MAKKDMFKTNAKAVASFLFVITTVFTSCKEPAEHQKVHEINKPFFYSEKNKTIYINNCDVVDLPDSLTSKQALHLVINCSKPTDYSSLISQISSDKIMSIRIDNLDNISTTFDFKGFVNLRRVSIFGTEKMNNIVIANLGDSIKSLYLSGQSLDLPSFDSTLLSLNTFYYKGRAKTIPKWVENLQNLRELRFASANLSEIESDICNMQNLLVFDVIGVVEKDKETEFENSKVYPALLQIKKCKPELELLYKLPPV
jgi:Leucine-rich repeat (LRR) protein